MHYSHVRMHAISFYSITMITVSRTLLHYFEFSCFLKSLSSNSWFDISFDIGNHFMELKLCFREWLYSMDKPLSIGVERFRARIWLHFLLILDLNGTSIMSAGTTWALLTIWYSLTLKSSQIGGLFWWSDALGIPACICDIDSTCFCKIYIQL